MKKQNKLTEYFYKNSRIILISCIILLYFERELATRNLSYWVNQNHITFLEILWLFLNPYILPILTLFLIIKRFKLSIVPIIYGFYKVFFKSYFFIKREIWQYSNFDNYQLFTPYDSYEIRTIITIFISIIFYSTAILCFYQIITVKYDK